MIKHFILDEDLIAVRVRMEVNNPLKESHVYAEDSSAGGKTAYQSTWGEILTSC